MTSDVINGDKLPWIKVEDASSKIQDDEEKFPTMEAWNVSFTDPKAIKPLQEYIRSRPTLWKRLQHLKLIKKTTSPSGETLFQMIVGVSPVPPDDLPDGYSSPERCIVPATASLSRGQLKVKNEIWPTIFSPHLLPVEISFTKQDVERFKEGMIMAIGEARHAAALGELPVAACILPDQYLDIPIVSHDTRKSTRHPLRHAVMNLVRNLADKVIKDSQELDKTASIPLLSQGVSNLDGTATSTPKSMADHSRHVETPTLQNGEGYQLTGRTLFLTHEPCLMCTMALVHSRVKEVVFIHSMPKTGGCGGCTIVADLPTINHRFNIWFWKKELIGLIGLSEGEIVISDTFDA